MGEQQGNSQQKFVRKLSASLHCLAQPLSIIQASLELALLKPTTVEQYREVAEGALREVGRATEAMRFAAQLAQFHQPATDVTEVRLSTEISGMLANQSRTLESVGIRVLFVAPEREQTFRFSATRLRQMLFYLVNALRDLSEAGDELRVEIEVGSGELTLKISRVREPGRDHAVETPARDSQVNRALALAEEIVSSGGGRFVFDTRALVVNVTFCTQGEERPHVAEKDGLSSSQLVTSSQQS